MMHFKNILSFQKLFMLAFLGCIGVLITSYLIESFFYIMPCQLCILQRFIYYVLAVIFLLGALQNPKYTGRYIYTIICLFFTILGILIAGRQIWIQHLPVELMPECAPGLARLLELFPLLEVIKIVLQGTNECFQIHFTILGLPLSNWSLFSFLGLTCVCLFVIYGQKKGGYKYPPFYCV